jgi:hypothetical protein
MKNEISKTTITKEKTTNLRIHNYRYEKIVTAPELKIESFPNARETFDM